MQSTNRTTLLRWCLWFFLGNAILFWLIGSHYFSTLSWVGTPYITSHNKFILKLFAMFAYLGHLGLLAIAPCILLIPCILFFPKRRFIFTLAILVATVDALLLAIDTVIYQLYRFHLNGMMISMAFSINNEVLGLSKTEYLRIGCVFFGLGILECFYAWVLWRYCLNKKSLRPLFQWLLIVMGLSLYCSYSMIAFSAGRVINRLLVEETRFLPYYTRVLGTLLRGKDDGQFMLEYLSVFSLLQPDTIKAPLHYPLQPLHFSKLKQHLNVVMIVIDAWRFDMLNPIVAPNLYKFAQKSWVFNNHFSGGNATGPGIFSLFYSLPASYWTAMETQQRGPLLIDTLLNQHYQMGVFASATLKLPPFNRTVFSAIKNLQLITPGTNAYERDRKITQEFTQFIAEAVKHPQPFFSFLFYDGAHSYCSYKNDLKPFIPAVPVCDRVSLTNHSDPLAYFNRYKNAVLLVDLQIKEVLSTLQAHHLLDKTVVLITGDHGEEFNDTHKSYWGHASDFNHFQTQTPLVVYWPGKKPQTFTQQTTHFDIGPTLMKLLLGCQTPPSDYSMGTNLLNPENRPYLVVGSYIGMGVIEPDRITTISPTGDVSIEPSKPSPLSEVRLNPRIMQQVFKDIRRFYQS